MPSLSYQGPKYFEEEVASIFDKIKECLPRQDDLSIIVGGIEQITRAKNRLRIVGDADVNTSIDRAFEALVLVHPREEDPEWNADAAEKWIRDLFKEVRFLPQEQPPVVYNPLFDAVLVDPEPFFEYILSKGVSLEHVLATNDTDTIEQYVIRACYPIYLAQACALWDFGNTTPHLRLQYYFCQQGFSFDKKKDGSFSYQKFFQQKLKKEQHVAAYGKAVNISQKMKNLRLYELEAYAALALTREKMYPLPGLEEVPIVINKMKHPAINQLSALVDNDFSQLLSFAKEKIEEAYVSERSVFSFLGLKEK